MARPLGQQGPQKWHAAGAFEIGPGLGQFGNEIGGCFAAMRDPAPGRETVERGDCQRFLVGIAAVSPRFADSRSRGDSVDRHSLKPRSEEHTSELQSLMRISYAVFCLKKKRPIFSSR